jgi:hypothetical protein
MNGGMMTPDQIIAALRAEGVDADSWMTGGGCGAVGIALPLDHYILITPEDGPYSYGRESEDFTGSWMVSLYDDPDGGRWIDAALMRDGTTPVGAGDIVAAVRELLA